MRVIFWNLLMTDHCDCISHAYSRLCLFPCYTYLLNNILYVRKWYINIWCCCMTMYRIMSSLVCRLCPPLKVGWNNTTRSALKIEPINTLWYILLKFMSYSNFSEFINRLIWILCVFLSVPKRIWYFCVATKTVSFSRQRHRQLDRLMNWFIVIGDLFCYWK